MRLMRAATSVIALLFALTACGGAGSEDTKPTPSDPNQETLLEYAQCMRDNGVQVPDPIANDPGSVYDGVDQNSAAFQSADGACSPILQGIVEGRQHNQEDQDAQQQELLELAECLREHGIDVPDPVPGAEKPFGDSLDRTDPATAQAIQECNSSGQG